MVTQFKSNRPHCLIPFHEEGGEHEVKRNKKNEEGEGCGRRGKRGRGLATLGMISKCERV